MIDWQEVLNNLWQNIVRTWFLWFFLVIVYPSLAALAILIAERRVKSKTITRYRDSLYFVAACMTIGSNATPESGWAKVIAIISGVIGIVFLGLMVWLISVSF